MESISYYILIMDQYFGQMSRRGRGKEKQIFKKKLNQLE